MPENQRSEQRIEELIQALQRVQIEQANLIHAIQQEHRASREQTRSNTAQPPNNGDIQVGDHARILNNYLGERGLEGRVVKRTLKTVTIRTPRGDKTRKLKNVLKLPNTRQ